MQYSYETLANDNVRFLQGTQAELNKYLPRSEDSKRGTAIEGAFYLTTDTHRLYVGRKVSDNNSADNGKVFPEEVSNGISVVQSAGSLPSAALEAHDGDLYYIKDGNILAAYEWDESTQTGSWQQINSPAEISALHTAFGTQYDDANGYYANISFNGVTASDTNAVSLIVEANTAGGGKADYVWLFPGNNVAFAQDTTGKAIRIDAIGNQELLTSNANSATNNSPVILREPTSNSSTQVNFVGAQDTAVSSVYENNASTITISSFQPTGVTTAALGTSNDNTSLHGFTFGVKGNDATGSVVERNSTSMNIDPQIYYGDTRGNNTLSSSYFHGGDAHLNVYTIAQTDNAISEAIQNNNKSLDALHWKGTVNSNAAVAALANSADGVAVGDVYKFIVDANTPSGEETGIVLNDQTIKNGDTIIATLANNATEDANGKIAAGDLVWAYVPSGDEPFVKGIATGGTGVTPSFGVVDDNLTTDKEILKVNVVGGNLINTIGETSANGANPKNFNVTISHAELANAFSTNNVSLVATNATADSISGAVNDTLTFFAVDPNNGFSVDAYGHLTGVSGNAVTIKHNYLTGIDRAYSATNATANGITSYTGTVVLAPQDSTGLSSAVSANGSVVLKSSTIAIAANDTSKDLTMDIVWGSF